MLVWSRPMSTGNRTICRQAIILQDHKRLPARFFARLSGSRTSRIG